MYVSNGPSQVPVPDVTGLSVHDATQILEQAGFLVQVNQGLGDHVQSYNPTGQAPKGSTITIVVGLTFP